VTRAARRPPDIALLEALRRAKDVIDRDYAEHLDLSALASAAGYSRFHFAREFAAAYGEPPRAYLTRRRIERAKDLLRSANLTVTEICVLVGFESLGSFSTRFRQLVGQPPAEYRAAAMAVGGPPRIPGCHLLMWTRPHSDAANCAIGEKPPAGVPGDDPVISTARRQP
jgi:AraC-like DNA-binding protein